MTWRITNVTPETLDEFVGVCDEFYSFTPLLKHLNYTTECFRAWGQRLIDDNTCFGQIAHDDTGPVGLMTGYVSPMLLSRSLLGVEEGIYVREGTPMRAAIAAEMLRRFVRFCIDAGAVDVRTGIISQIDTYATDVFYRRNGFKCIGTIYSLRDPPGEQIDGQ